MADYKMQMLQEMEIALIPLLDAESRTKVVDALTNVISGYDVNKAVTDLIPYENVNGMLLKKYCACLLIEGKSEKTVRLYKRTAEDLERVVGKLYTDMGVYDIRMYLATKKQDGVSNRTLENYRANLSAFFQWLLQEEHITKNPCMNIQPIKYTDKVRLPFSSVEIDALRFACKTDKERAIIEVLLSTGVRVSELTALTLSDINFNDLSVHVTKGKGAKERTVYMNDLARTHLQTYLMGRKEFGTHLFYNKKKEPLNAGGVRHILHEIAKRAGVDNVHPHRFRRTFATGLVSRGMEIQEVRKLLGHSNLNTTLEYVYTSDEKVHASYLRFSA